MDLKGSATGLSFRALGRSAVSDHALGGIAAAAFGGTPGSGARNRGEGDHDDGNGNANVLFHLFRFRVKVYLCFRKKTTGYGLTRE